MSERKVRCDAIIEGLPEEQRGQVDGWLLDKGLTYQQVATACMTRFGVKVSRSSVARYYERRMKERVRAQKLKQQRELLPLVEIKEFGDGHEVLVERLTEMAWDYMDRQWDEERWSVRRLVRLVRLVLALKREGIDQERLQVERDTFELKLAKRVIRHHQKLKREERREERNRPDENGWRRTWSKLYRIEGFD
jgi:hypothetical protein